MYNRIKNNTAVKASITNIKSLIRPYWWHDNKKIIGSENHYRSVDQDEFPVAQYLSSKWKTFVSRILKYDYNSYMEYDNLVELIDELKFNEVHSVQKFEGITNLRPCSLYSRNVYELTDDIGSVLLLCGDIPVGAALPNHKVYPAIYSNARQETFDMVKDKVLEFTKTSALTKSNIHLVISDHGAYDTQVFNLPESSMDIELNYGSEFLKKHQLILDSLNTVDGKGLVLLHGDPGTGKTHYLKHLAANIKNKKVLFIPPYLTDFITSPEMIPFLLENENCVLFIEDAERALEDRIETGSPAVSNILNITDGILSDILKIQIVATFNMDKKKIDSALLRKGRLITEHKFGPLEVEDANILLKKFEIDHITTEKMTLSEIYNFKDENFVETLSTNKNKIGFGF